MPNLTVTAPAVAFESEPLTQTSPVEASLASPLLIVRGLAFGIGLVGLFVAFRRKSRLAGVLTAICLVVGVGSFRMGSTVPAAEAGSASSPATTSNSSIPQVELGQQLFIAKGCITCHVNTKVPNSDEYWTIDMGATNLSTFSANPEILRIRLKDPTQAKSDTQMPNLGLSDSEIEALIAFINSQ